MTSLNGWRLRGVLYFSWVLLSGEHSALAQNAPVAPAEAATPSAGAPATESPAPSAPSPPAAPVPAALDGITQTGPSERPPPFTPPPAPPPEATTEKPENKLRLELGGRLGYAMPYGDVTPSRKLKDVFSAAIAGVFDAWLRVPGGFALGLYIGVAPGISGKALDSCGDCSALNYRFGFQLARHFNSGGIVDPWLGVGVGAEYSTITQQFDMGGINYKYDFSYRAVPELIVQAGIDIGSDTLAFGPFASVSYAAYSQVSSTLSCTNLGCGDGATSSGNVPDTSGHGWLTLGIRGTYLR